MEWIDELAPKAIIFFIGCKLQILYVFKTKKISATKADK